MVILEKTEVTNAIAETGEIKRTVLRSGVRRHQKWSHGPQANMRADVSMRCLLASSRMPLRSCLNRLILPTTLYASQPNNRQRSSPRTQYQYQLSQMDPRDALPRAHRAIHRGRPIVCQTTVASIVNIVRPTTVDAILSY